MLNDNGKLQLRPGVLLHMCVSEPPCGDASIFAVQPQASQPSVTHIQSDARADAFRDSCLESHTSCETGPCTDIQTDGRTDPQTHGRTDHQTAACTDFQTGTHTAPLHSLLWNRTGAKLIAASEQQQQQGCQGWRRFPCASAWCPAAWGPAAWVPAAQGPAL